MILQVWHYFQGKNNANLAKSCSTPKARLQKSCHACKILQLEETRRVACDISNVSKFLQLDETKQIRCNFRTTMAGPHLWHSKP